MCLVFFVILRHFRQNREPQTRSGGWCFCLILPSPDCHARGLSQCLSRGSYVLARPAEPGKAHRTLAAHFEVHRSRSYAFSDTSPILAIWSSACFSHTCRCSPRAFVPSISRVAYIHVASSSGRSRFLYTEPAKVTCFWAMMSLRSGTRHSLRTYSGECNVMYAPMSVL